MTLFTWLSIYYSSPNNAAAAALHCSDTCTSRDVIVDCSWLGAILKSKLQTKDAITASNNSDIENSILQEVQKTWKTIPLWRWKIVYRVLTNKY